MVNDLPVPPAASQGNSQISTNNPIIQSSNEDNTQTISSGSINKEAEVGGIQSGEALPLKDIGTHEIKLSAEVARAGVKVQPTTIPLPQNVQQLGVKPSGPMTPVGSGASVTLPLTDDQIAKGLHQSITSSWRWLAEWCVRKIKQLHRGFTGKK